MQRTANILSTEAPTENGGNLLSYPREKVQEIRDLGWLFFDRSALRLDWRGVRAKANTLSTDPPTGIVGKHTEISCPLNQCGSGLARESGGPFNFDAAETTLSRASPLPQGVFSVWRIVVSERRLLQSGV
ncbi:hypothetical protein C1894_20620 [Pseudomonas sp. FW305-3-2-15-E-TSA2]|nr:hypothetical protein C1895_19445 [Pseudomonas sp. FW305-3-2-15-E-TSA4]POA38906.1 hypothetical protein C1894_20620 [Pseudomonas sp. FW305-3-2-15-E-TSA2]